MNKDIIDLLSETDVKNVLRTIIGNGKSISIDDYLKFNHRLPEIHFFLRAMDETKEGEFIASTYVRNSMERLKNKS